MNMIASVLVNDLLSPDTIQSASFDRKWEKLNKNKIFWYKNQLFHVNFTIKQSTSKLRIKMFVLNIDLIA